MSSAGLKKVALPVALVLSALLHLAMFSWTQDNSLDAGRQAEQDSVRVEVELLRQQVQAIEKDVNLSADESRHNVVDVESGNVARRKPVAESLVETQMPVKHMRPREEVAAQELNVKQQNKAATVNKDSDQLLKLIYVEINKHKHYPFMAIKRRREGLVTINFVMHPDGQVTDIAIVESSHYAILDNAARRAIEAISPFQLASKYISMRQNYNVGVDFRLN